MTPGHGRACHGGGYRRCCGLASGAAVALPLALVVAVRSEVAVAAEERELAVARRAAGRATDPLCRGGGGRRTEPPPAFGAAMAALDGHPDELPVGARQARLVLTEGGRPAAIGGGLSVTHLGARS